MRLTDTQIRGAIRAVEARDGRLSGVAVRAELERLHGGARGGVARVYRLLRQARGAARHAEAAALVDRVRALEAQLELVTARAERSEHREVVHQDRAAMEIHALREKLRELEKSPAVRGVRHEDYLALYREVVRLRQRVAEFEAGQEVAAGGPGLRE